MYNFGNEGVDGVYLVLEENDEAITAASDPFFVSIPMTNPDRDGWLYNVNVYPKNDLEPAPVIDKDVINVGNDYGTFDVDEIFTYIIQGEIPEGLATAKHYALTDTLDTRLDYEGNVAVKLYNETEQELLLSPITHYLLKTTPATESAGASLKVSLTKEGMEYVMKNLGKDVENIEPKLRVYFDASLNTDADLGTRIPNNAKIEYTNATGYEYAPGEVPVEERPEVETGGMNILKYDAADATNVLADAQFKLERPAKTSDPIEEIKHLVVNGTTQDIVYVDFYATEDMTGKKIDVAITDENGEAVIYGLAYGEYYLVEIKAPEGYNLLRKPVTVTIDAYSHTDAEVIKVANSNHFRFPETGGMGIAVFTGSGAVMLTAAAVILGLKKKEDEES